MKENCEYDWDSTEILVCPECNERMSHKLARRKSYECQCCGNIFVPKALPSPDPEQARIASETAVIRKQTGGYQ